MPLHFDNGQSHLVMQALLNLYYLVKPAIPQAYFNFFLDGIANNHRAPVIRSAVSERFGGALQNVDGHTRVMANDAENSAHPRLRFL